jgi:hypothetical protein
LYGMKWSEKVGQLLTKIRWKTRLKTARTLPYICPSIIVPRLHISSQNGFHLLAILMF